MFMQSFENSGKQQERRRSRQMALQRMEEAMSGLVHAGENNDNGGNEGGATAPDYAEPELASIDSAAIEGAKDEEVVTAKLPSGKDHPWKSNATGDTNDATTMNAHSAMSVTSASNFLRETQMQFSPPTSPPPPRHPSSPSFPLPPLAHLANSNAARQFLWDDQSAATSHSGGGVNLHDIKNSFARRDDTKFTLARNKGQRGRGARWMAIHGNRKNSGEEEGEQLLHLAERRLGDKPVDKNTAALIREYGEIIEDDDGDSFINDEDAFVRRRVYLDREGNLSYGDNGNNDDLHSRRMMNSYKRALKRPMVLICAIAAAAAIVVVVGKTFYPQIFSGMNDGAGGGDVGSSWNATSAEITANGGEDTSAVGEDVPLDKPRFDHIRYVLVDRKASPPEVFMDKQSAQYAALVWLTRDDPRQLDPESVYIAQRYGLAVLWFSTTKSGYEWHDVQDEKYYDDDATDDEFNDDDEDEGDNDRRKIKEVDPTKWFVHDNWLSSTGVCGWYGIQCFPHDNNGNVHDANNDGDVSHIELRRNNLHGLFPLELYTTLPYLRVLDLSDNGFAGTISEQVGHINWKGLESLNFTSNNIAGSIPSSIGKLTSLKDLHLGSNLLEESIPSSIGMLTSLRKLDLSGNSFKGSIPYEMGEMKQLSSLNLSYNLLLGPLPHEFSKLKKLVSLDVSHNNLGGPLITELSDVTYLANLRLNDNHFSGEIPTAIGNLIHMEELHLNNNDFKGTLPAEISKLEGLDSINLAHNHFEGSFPPEWTGLAGLRELDISTNELMGEIPIFIDGMKDLRSLNMAHNDFSSSIPSQLGSLYKLETIFLDDNEFEGTVPTELGELTNLKKLTLHNNLVTGSIDVRICKLNDELFLTQLSADCSGEMPEIECDCCICHVHEPIVHLNTNKKNPKARVDDFITNKEP